MQTTLIPKGEHTSPKKERRTRSWIITLFSISVLSAAIYVGARAMRSPLYTLNRIEVLELNQATPPRAPVDAKLIKDLTGLTVGQVNLFSLNLAEVEKKIQIHPWIESVRLQKKFPETLTIEVALKKPKVIHQRENGQLVYVDSRAEPIAEVKGRLYSNYPVISGVQPEAEQQIQNMIRLVDEFPAQTRLQLSSITWNQHQGYRALILYPAKKLGTSRTVLELGQEIDDTLSSRMHNLGSVLVYLLDRSQAADRIWLGDAKKIVVKLNQGS